MAYDYFDLAKQATRWAEQAAVEGWIAKESLEQVPQASASPNALFREGQERPLLVAFMGGTGVGKSSLLNRLAGKSVARTGVERPTSKEVTLFHHRSVALQYLPGNLPVASVRVAQHDDESKRHIIWIDTPDFDSVDQHNRQLVLEWLPHIDVLIYVVSPERYRDAKAWRLLLAEGARHAWLFVLNQWDRGQIAQYDDFLRQLGKAGFADPIVFKTICAEERQSDEFDALQQTLNALANAHTVSQLEQRGQHLRLEQLRNTLERYRHALAAEKAFGGMTDGWRQQWRRTQQLLEQGFVWPVQQLAQYYAEHAVGLLTNPSAGKYPAAKAEAVFWDPWAKSRFDDALDAFILEAEQTELPALPLKRHLAGLRDKAPRIIEQQIELAVRQSLANPGNALQRTLLRIANIAEIVLPLSALSWVGYRVFAGFQLSNAEHSAYLGVDFLIHSALLVSISWLVPWFLAKKLKPSLKASALRGLQKGLASAFAAIDAEAVAALEHVRSMHADQHRQVNEMIKQCEKLANERQIPLQDDSPLMRMLLG